MLNELKFVMGAVSKKELVPAMSHFAIEDGTIRSYNGSMALCSPFPIDLHCKPKASQLTQAIANCNADYPVTMVMTSNNKLRISNGPFTVTVECLDEDFPHPKPAGDIVYFDGTLMRKAFENIIPFIGNDAERSWSNGVLLHGKSAFATNNVIMVEYWLGTNLPFTVNVPKEAVKEVLRVGEIPTHCQLDNNSITFHFPNSKWIRTQLYATKWPEAADKIFEVNANPLPIAPDFFNAIESISPFVDKVQNVYFRNGGVSSVREGEDGAHYKIHEFDHYGAYALPMLELLKGTAHKIDWTSYPKPCIFYGDNMRGAIIGRWISEADLEKVRAEEEAAKEVVDA